MFLVVLPYLRMLKASTRYSGGHIQYTTLDILTVTFGFAPTAWLTAMAVQNSRGSDDALLNAIFCFVFYGSSQLAGMLMFIATNAAPTRIIRSDSASAGSIMIGALVGLLMPIVGLFLIIFNTFEKQHRRHLEILAQTSIRAAKSRASRTTAGPRSRPGSPS